MIPRVCVTVVWAINAASFTKDFIVATEQRLGVAPQPTDLLIASARVRPSAAHFTLTRRMCDCHALVGLRGDPEVEGETTASDLLGWLRDLPSVAPHTIRVAVLRAWSPTQGAIKPARARDVGIADVDEHLLRGIGDEELVTIDYPR